jgi:hypothetical protein
LNAKGRALLSCIDQHCFRPSPARSLRLQPSPIANLPCPDHGGNHPGGGEHLSQPPQR